MTHEKPIIAAVVAMSENRVIGNHNQLPWHLPADLQHFKAITTGATIVMGRKTFEAIGRPLPHRHNIIISRDINFLAAGCNVAHSLNEALTLATAYKSTIFIIGGAQIYAQSMPLIQRLYLTVVHHVFQGDAFFPAINPEEWQVIEEKTYAADDRNPYAYTFFTMDRV